MVMIKDRKGKDAFYMEEILYAMTTEIKRRLANDDTEIWGLFYGKTGTGKSLKAQHWGYIIDKDISIKQVCYDVDEFIHAVVNAPKGSVVIADEGISIFFSRSSMTKEGRAAAEISAQIRQKNLCIFICVPNPVTMDYTVLEKVNFVAEISESRQKDKDGNVKTVKGNVSVYLKKQIPRLLQHLKSQKGGSSKYVSKPKPFARQKGDFVTKTPFYPVEEKEYRQKKESVLDKYLKKGLEPDKPKSSLQQKQFEQKGKLILLLREELKLSYGELERKTGIPKSTLKDAYNRAIS